MGAIFKGIRNAIRLEPFEQQPLHKVIWSFQPKGAAMAAKKEEAASNLDRFFVITDADEGLGGSSEATLTQTGKGARFSGVLSTKKPSSGKVVRSGFCLMRSKLEKPASIFVVCVERPCFLPCHDF